MQNLFFRVFSDYPYRHLNRASVRSPDASEVIRHVNWRQNTFIYLILSIVLASVCLPRKANAVPENAVVMMRNPLIGMCASGFFTSPNTLVTAYHVAESLCPLRDCTALRIVSGPGLAPTVTIKRVLDLPASDIATFSVNPPWQGEILSVSQQIWAELPRVNNSSVTAISFPGCQQLETKSGILSVSNDGRELSTSAPLAHGSSGGAILNDKSEVVGVVSEAASVQDALLSIFFGQQFAKSRISSIAVLAEVTGKNSQEVLRLQAHSLLNEYLTDIVDREGMDRWQHSASFLGRAENLFMLQTRLGTNTRGIAILPPAKQVEILKLESGQDSDSTDALLRIITSLEKFGPRITPMREAPLGFFAQQISQISGIDMQYAGKVISQMELSSYPGSELGLILWCVKATLVAIGVITLLVVSLTVVFLKTRGGFFSKAATTTLVLVCLWPLSVIAWGFRQSRLPKKKSALQTAGYFTFFLAFDLSLLGAGFAFTAFAFTFMAGFGLAIFAG